MTVFNLFHDCLDALLHPSARDDAMTGARHRAFMAPRLLGSLAALAAFPVYLAMRGAPSALEVVAFGWLIAPILLTYFLSRTGRFESAQILSSIALAGLVMTMSLINGGIGSFAVVWLVIVPLEAALSASRRVVMFAFALALSCISTLLVLSSFGLWLHTGVSAASQELLTVISVATATIYGTGIALGSVALARIGSSLLSKEEDRYRLLARNMSDVISRHRRNGAVEFISPAVEQLLGTASSGLLEHGLFDRVHVADRPAYLTALSAAARGNEASSVEFRVRRDVERGRPGAGEFIWVEMRCRPMDVGAANAASAEAAVVAVMRDVTDRKNQEEALAQAKIASERSDASKSRFLATMSHELRTPLNAIIGFSEMITKEDELHITAARRQEYAQLINDSGRHLLSVVNGILDMSKIESGSFEISPEPFAPRPAIVNCCNLLALKARENDIDLITRAPDDLPDIVGDPRAFKQIMLNLVSNAVKFTERGGSVTVTAGIENAKLIVRVIDTGVGIDAEDLKRIGDPFFQAGSIYQRRHEGTGLGLSIVKNLVGMQGGNMSVQSRIDEGTTITISLPLEFSPPAQPASNIATLAPVARMLQPDNIYQVKKIA